MVKLKITFKEFETDPFKLEFSGTWEEWLKHKEPGYIILEKETIIYRKYFDDEEIEETTLKVALDKLEGSEFWKKGTVEELLKNGEVVRNPFCEYANSKELLNN